MGFLMSLLFFLFGKIHEFNEKSLKLPPPQCGSLLTETGQSLGIVCGGGEHVIMAECTIVLRLH